MRRRGEPGSALMYEISLGLVALSSTTAHGTNRTGRAGLAMSVDWGRREIAGGESNRRERPIETSALGRRRPDRSRLRLHQAFLQPPKSSAANSRIKSYLIGKSAWAAISQVSHTRRLRDPKIL